MIAAIPIMAHQSGSGSIKKTAFIAKIGPFATDRATDPNSIKMRIAGMIGYI